MSWDVRVLRVPSRESDLAVLVTSDQSRFLFNCGEGTQRTFVQTKQSMRKLKAVFLTDSQTSAIAGLPGLMLSASDAGVASLDVFGPEAAAQYLASCRNFLQRDTMNARFESAPQKAGEPIFQTPSLDITAVPLGLSTPVSEPMIADDGRPSSPRTEIPGGENGSFDWQRFGWNLRDLNNDQLKWWRRTIISDMFKGQSQPEEVRLPHIDNLNGAGPSSNGATSAPVERRSTAAARSQLGQRIPRYARDSKLEPEMKEDVKYAYIIQGGSVRGKFDNAKAKELGVPNGPIRRNLMLGESIEVDDPSQPGGKRTIQPEDVIGADKDGGACIIVDITKELIEELIQSIPFKQYQNMAGGRHAHVVIHRTSSQVLNDKRYQEWMTAFGSETHHILAITDIIKDDANFPSAAWNLTRMSYLDSEIFPLPIIEPTPRIFQMPAIPGLEGHLHLADGYLSTRVYPPTPPGSALRVGSDMPYPTTVPEQEIARAALPEVMPKYAEIAKQCRSAPTNAPKQEESLPEHFGMSVIPFGTGSAVPSKYRNVSATLVDIPETGYVLLDVGEGTLGQFHRRYTSEHIAKEIYPNLKLIVISHMHADHHIGLRLLLESWLETTTASESEVVRGSTVYLVGPSFIALHLLENGIELGKRIKFIDSYHISSADWDVEAEDGGRSPPRSPTNNSKTSNSRPNQSIGNAKLCKSDLGLTGLFSPLVDHRGKAYGFVASHSRGWKIVYSGDTKPCDNLVKFGKDATLLIHEATLEDDKPEMAIKKGHSTFGQAIDIGYRMNARYLLLNHFSQRYPKHPQIAHFSDPSSRRTDDAAGLNGEDVNEENLGFQTTGPIVAMAYDLMVLPLRDFRNMERYLPALDALFEQVAKEEDNEKLEEEAKEVGEGAASGRAEKGKGQEGKGNEKKVKGKSGKSGNQGPGRDQQDRVTIPSTTTPSERTTNKSERKKAARESHLLAQKSKQGGAGSGTEGGGQGGKINVEEVNESSSKGSSKKRPTENGSVSGDLDRDDRVQGHEVDAGGDVNVVGEEDGRETKKARKGI